MGSIRVVLFGVGLLAWVGAAAQQASGPEEAAARKAIVDLNAMWGRARVAVDKPTFEKTLAPDFYVEIDGQRQTRQEFIDEISRTPGPVKMNRFDVDVLTVMKNGDHWDAVIQEELQAQGIGKDGKRHRYYSLWVTKDGWKPDGDHWVALYSIAIGHQNWRDEKPPVSSWGA